MRIPSNLNLGDKVAIVATAKRMEVDYQPAIDTLREWGLDPIMGKFPLEFNGYFAGTDEQKIEDLQWALDSEEIKAIVFIRGGYGTTKILDRINFKKFTESPKWLVGYSDLTSMIMQLDTLEIPMLHGPMCYTLGSHKASDDSLRNFLFGGRGADYKCKSVISGATTAKIVGGNLSMVYESIGAPNEIQTAGNVLFLEDVGEQMYSIDRMMTKLKRSGKLNGIKGLILGSFTEIGNMRNFFAESVEELILSYFAKDVIIATDLNIGHDKENLALIMNQPCKIEVSNDRLNLNYL